jgi:quinolinate synthase
VFAPTKKPLALVTPTVCMCSTVFGGDPLHLPWTQAKLVSAQVVNAIHVAPDEVAEAKRALGRMLQISS